MNYPLLRLDDDFRSDLIRYFSIAAIFYIIAALFGIGFTQADSHFQTLEFADFKLHPHGEEFLPWEHREAIRPWLQPYLYLGVIKSLNWLGIQDPILYDRAIRLLSGAFGLAATFLFCIVLAIWLPLSAQKRWLSMTFGLFWFFPALHTRTSSENLSSICLLLAISSLFLLQRKAPCSGISDNKAGPFTGEFNFSPEGLAASAVCLGLMIDFRYQTAALAMALIFWMIAIARTPVVSVLFYCLVLLSAIALSVAIDSIGYGSFQLVPWNYFKVNILEGVASGFGKEGWYFYFTNFLTLPIGLCLIVSMVLFWIRYPKNLLTWMTAAFYLEHSIIGHKELRFIFPIMHLILATSIFVIPRGWFESSTTGNPFKGSRPWIRYVFYCFSGLNFAALTAESIRTGPSEVRVQTFINRIEPDHFEFYSFGSSPFKWRRDYKWGYPLRMEFYAPKQVTQHTLNGVIDLETAIVDRGPLYFYNDRNELPSSPEWSVVGGYCRLVYQTYGEYLRLINFNDWQGKEHPVSLYKCAALKSGS